MVNLDSVKDAATDFITDNAVPIAIGTGVAVVGAGLVGLAVAGSNRKKKTSSKRGRSRDRKFISKQKWERNRKRKTPGKRYKTKRSKRSKSRKGVKYTKNGQPYIILASGKARFIKGKRRAR